MSAASSAMAMTVALVLPRTADGTTEASDTREPSVWTSGKPSPAAVNSSIYEETSETGDTP